ncbi:hypothetical protein GALMADRAFT_1358617 [Galerina marginata CBS 339.88]|uniref:Uncharacterized protein n=1 Tax=Galerina marginata (strain CBS 339.88) TaxID=685588 RepID=A0A067S8V1_GALM3|nr:hypothetical protein GALMADRAFT_1358617 [Galerina marginata CBS 339.88]
MSEPLAAVTPRLDLRGTAALPRYIDSGSQAEFMLRLGLGSGAGSCGTIVLSAIGGTDGAPQRLGRGGSNTNKYTQHPYSHAPRPLPTKPPLDIGVLTTLAQNSITLTPVFSDPMRPARGQARIQTLRTLNEDAKPTSTSTTRAPDNLVGSGLVGELSHEVARETRNSTSMTFG